jgi:hypothetical protein
MVNRMKARTIHTELESVYGPQALARPAVKKLLRPFHHGRTDLLGDPRSGGPLTNDLAGATGSMLEERPFNSCKALCRHFRIEMAMLADPSRQA